METRSHGIRGYLIRFLGCEAVRWNHGGESGSEKNEAVDVDVCICRWVRAVVHEAAESGLGGMRRG